jgi:hypothetical protein
VVTGGVAACILVFLGVVQIWIIFFQLIQHGSDVAVDMSKFLASQFRNLAAGHGHVVGGKKCCSPTPESGFRAWAA